MRKQLLLFIFLGCFAGSKAQTNVYHPLPNDSLVWLELWMDSSGGYNYYINEMVGDTTIGAYNYKKLYQSHYWLGPFYTPPVPLNYIGAIRQDIPAKRIYKMGTSGTEKLLYDFNKVVGDTLAFVQTPFTDTLYVASIDSVLVGGQYHKEFHVSNSPAASAIGLMPSPVIEGLGNYAGFGNYYDYGFEFGYQLYCFSQNNVHLYPPGIPARAGPNCFISVGIAEITKENFRISVSPNPTTDAFHLNVSCNEKYNVKITNDNGQIMIEKQNQTATELTFDIENYPDGIYFIRISDSKGDFITKKIVKQ